MAKTSDTSISKTQAAKFIASATKDEELSCEKIKGFHLRKTQKGGTWRIRYTDFSGKIRKLSLGKYVDGTADRINATQDALNYRNELNKGFDPKQEIDARKKAFRDEESTRASRLVGAYLSGPYTLHQASKENGGKHTLDIIRRAFSDLLNRPMNEITKSDIHEWQKKYTNSRIDKKTKEIKPRSYETVSRAYSAFKTMIRHAYKNKVIDVFPLAEVSLMEMTAVEKEALHNKESNKRRMLTDSEVNALNLGLELYKQQLIDRRENSRNHGKAHLPSYKNIAYPNWFFPFFRLAAYTGMRPGDLYSLQWHQLNLQFKRLVKVPNKTRHHKSPAKLDIPLNQGILNVMQTWKIQTKPESESALVFPSPVTGQALSKDAHEKPWANVLRLGNVPVKLDFYSLRHHYISKLVSNGTPLFTVARLAGHKSTKMIEEHYGHLSPHHAAAALDSISSDFQEAQL
ncbi:MAG: integrase [Aestuariibacter sp.]|nr:integrase [Aestuariibacter sp.]MAP21747.1 integrase [Alteromonadaceae bacterium]MAX41535.1 integrase [Alteromonadaceae bacterium]|tara:strand:+ start:3276 stop:4649 length:1374 start_codon:yes stop_codon:yes gene_type:complete